MNLPTWDEQLRSLDGVVDELLATWRPEGASEEEVQDMNKLALSILASGYLCRVHTDARRPIFMPLWNYAINQGGPDPDYVYSTTEVVPDGVYVISGTRGTARFVEITQQTFDMMNMGQLGNGSPVPHTHDLDDLTLDGEGRFRVILSAERPDDWAGDWWPLDPRTKRLLMRKCACDWAGEVDARVAISRLDDAGADMSPQETARRISDLRDWILGMIGFDMGLVRWYREHHGVNTFMRSTKIDSIGGLPTQAYYDGIYEIDDDEALIVDAELPGSCRYWQALVADDRFCTVDWVNRQSSINDTQAHIDADGHFRFVVSHQDPGVPNWLDKADNPWGIIQMRFNRGDRYPDPSIVKVPVADVRAHLPPETPVVTVEHRREQLAQRREAAQMRQIW
ncbi:MAG: DUF1214 domain-containing protein [Ilumatobacter sp.]|nr:MAG: DUF1214 domain-containing protein [Ilumatobacter sp.]